MDSDYFKIIKEGYSKIKDKEKERLFKNKYKYLEFKTTMYFIEKYVKEKSLILDAGGGPGTYTIELAKKGHEIILLDLCSDLLEIAKQRIKENRIENNVKAVIEGSITDLSLFEDNYFDVVLCLGGALNHVLNLEDRDKAVKELIRVLKPNGFLFISVIGRLDVVKKVIRYWPDELGMKHYDEILYTGDYNGKYGFLPAHFFLPEELEGLLANKEVKILEKVGLEGLATGYEEEFSELMEKHPEKFEKWWEYHIYTCTRPSIVDISEHFLFVCQKIKK